MLKIKSIKAHAPIQPGHKRVYEQCKACDRVFYRDYVPFSLANPILTLPCGHGAAERHHERVRGLDEQVGMRKMLEQLEAR